MEPRSHRLALKRAHTETFPDRYADLVQRLRFAFPSNDRLLIGYSEIRQFLSTYGVETKARRPPSDQVLRRWHKKHKFPMVKPRVCRRGLHHSSEAVTTTMAVVAWLLAYPMTSKERFMRFAPAVGRRAPVGVPAPSPSGPPPRRTPRVTRTPASE